MTYKSNADKVLTRLKSKINKTEMDAMNKEIAQSIFASNLSRIHNKGKAVNDSKIGSYKNGSYRNKIRTGEWKYMGGRYHRQIAFVDLEMTGQLRTSWKMLKDGFKYVIGFASKYGSDVSSYAEERFKKQIWGITKEDKEIARNIVKRHFHAI